MTISKLREILKEWRMKRWELGQISPRTFNEIISAMTAALNEAGWYVMPIVYGRYTGREQFINADGLIVEEEYCTPNIIGLAAHCANRLTVTIRILTMQ